MFYASAFFEIVYSNATIISFIAHCSKKISNLRTNKNVYAVSVSIYFSSLSNKHCLSRNVAPVELILLKVQMQIFHALSELHENNYCCQKRGHNSDTVTVRLLKFKLDCI